MNWTPEELSEIAAADDFRIAPFREDGKTYGTPTFIWSVVADDALYVRAYNGTRSRWYQAALEQKAGRISVAGKTHEVRFEPVSDDATNDAVDDAYRAKYARSSYLAPMISSRTRAATVRVTPREG
ncbi:DUF2255 family protein [Martelella radicis]|uniref:DUF2255 domain-containing protein n=1 Tax=Martelella radicis TaxID=1397476 RepID=A0A7W6KJZ8_9HYPH|nr:DUF2255 family protein [Martelella radicis]MBB4121295.1 hypothetical protein [Martelella radicis]